MLKHKTNLHLEFYYLTLLIFGYLINIKLVTKSQTEKMFSVSINIFNMCSIIIIY